jgi:hypothetical protein
MTKKSPQYLRRYTSLPILLDILSKRKITLLDPDSWEDRNDAYFIKSYKSKMMLETVLAICFSTKDETFHHWKVFSPGVSGVYIEFDGPALLKSIQGGEFRHRAAIYKYILELKAKKPDVGLWPFLKRAPFKDEGEYRIIYQNKNSKVTHKEIAIQLQYINKIMLSPWLPREVAKNVSSVIRSIAGCSNLVVRRSSLIETESWKASIDEDQDSCYV